MKILLSNDDGVQAPGLVTLFDALSQISWVTEVTVVAPDRDRSAASNSLTIDMPLRIAKQANGFYAVSGTPTDSVHIAITGFLDNHPDMIIAGINHGANLGDDLLYSGTVAAAMEGRFLGYPAIAVSLVTEQNPTPYYETAVQVVQNILERMQHEPLPKDLILNINVPNRPYEALRGFKTTRLGHRHCAENIIHTTDPKGKPILWIGPAGKEQDAGPGTDFHAVNQGFVSITPIKIDLTDYAALEKVAAWSESLHMNQ